MRSTPKIDAALRARLKEAVDRFAGGSADKFGRLIGYANGGYIREALREIKPVREKIIDRVHAAAAKEPGLRMWFEEIMPSAPAPDSRSALLLEAFGELDDRGRRTLLAIAEQLRGPGGPYLMDLFSRNGSSPQPAASPTASPVRSAHQ